jgi:hypothetical protein
MTWVKIDDSFPDHPKVIGLSDKAFRVHIEGLCYCGRFLTDGFIPMAVAARFVDDDMRILAELSEAGLWREKLERNGFEIHDYLEHQSSKSEVTEKKESTRERAKRYREAKKKTSAPDDDWENLISNVSHHAEVTASEYREQSTDTENRVQRTEDNNLPLPRVKSAKNAVEVISHKLSEARANGINAWNLSKLVEDEWDKLHNADDIGGCIALTAWYVSELQTRQLNSVEISRIGQMTKRFGRIALLAIDEAASKDLTDLVSYAYRVAQNMYKEKAGK